MGGDAKTVVLYGNSDGGTRQVLAQADGAGPNVDAVGSNGPLKQPYRSFRLGTERP